MPIFDGGFFIEKGQVPFTCGGTNEDTFQIEPTLISICSRVIVGKEGMLSYLQLTLQNLRWSSTNQSRSGIEATASEDKNGEHLVCECCAASSSPPTTSERGPD